MQEEQTKHYYHNETPVVVDLQIPDTKSPESQPLTPSKILGEYSQIVDEYGDAIKGLVQRVIDKRIARNPRYTNMSVVLNKANVHYDNNLTVVVVDTPDEQVVGWAKFNPKDVRYIRGQSRKGRYWERCESKYRDMAGIMKAIDRVVDKILNP